MPIVRFSPHRVHATWAPGVFAMSEVSDYKGLEPSSKYSLGGRRINERTDNQAWREVLDFWFPEGLSFQIDATTHRHHWFWRMRGGADGEIRDRFTELTAEGAAGNLDHWPPIPKAGSRSSSCSISSRDRSGAEAPALSRRTRRRGRWRWRDCRTASTPRCPHRGSRSFMVCHSAIARDRITSSASISSSRFARR